MSSSQLRFNSNALANTSCWPTVTLIGFSKLASSKLIFAACLTCSLRTFLCDFYLGSSLSINLAIIFTLNIWAP